MNRVRRIAALFVTILIGWPIAGSEASRVRVTAEEVQSARQVAQNKIVEYASRGQKMTHLGYRSDEVAASTLGEPYIFITVRKEFAPHIDASMSQVSEYLMGYRICVPLYLNSNLIGVVKVIKDQGTGEQRVVSTSTPNLVRRVEDARHIYPESTGYDVELLHIDELGLFVLVYRGDAVVSISAATRSAAHVLGTDAQGEYHLELLPFDQAATHIRATGTVPR